MLFLCRNMIRKPVIPLMKARTPQASVISSLNLSQKQVKRVSYYFSIHIQSQVNSSLEVWKSVLYSSWFRYHGWQSVWSRLVFSPVLLFPSLRQNLGAGSLLFLKTHHLPSPHILQGHETRLGWLSWDDHEFEASLSEVVRSCLKNLWWVPSLNAD